MQSACPGAAPRRIGRWRAALPAMVLAFAGIACAQNALYIDLSGDWRVRALGEATVPFSGVHGTSDGHLEFAAPGYDDTSWGTIRMPQPQGLVTKLNPLRNYWLRRKVELPAVADRTQLALTLGAVQDVYQVYVNGVLIGASGDFESFADAQLPRPRTFDIPAGVAGASGPLTIALRVRWALNMPPLWRLLDSGPYLLTSRNVAPRQAATIQLQERWISASPELIVGAVFAALGILSFFFWLADRSRVELLWFAGIGFARAYSAWCRCSVLLDDSFPFAASGFTRAEFVIGNFYQPVTAMFALTAVGTKSRRLYAALWVGYLVPLALLPWFRSPSLLQFLARLLLFSFAHFWPAAVAAAAVAHHWWRRRSQHLLHLVLALPLLNFAQDWFRRLLSPWLGNTSYLTGVQRLGSLWFLGDDVFLLFISAITLALLYRRVISDSRERHRLSGEMEAARVVQQLLISKTPARESIDAVYEPAQEVGGDFYQVIPVEDGSQLIAAGDVSGKGLKAAMVVSLVTGAIRNRQSDAPGAILGELNRVLCESLDGGFVTAVVARFFDDGQIVLANAGHPPPYLQGSEVSLPEGLPLGIDTTTQYEERALPMAAREQMTFVSDGVIEAANANGELFGFERTREISTKPAKEIASVARAWGQNDDITVVTVRRAAS